MSLLTCRGLCRNPWLHDVDLDLASGEAVVLRGPVGAGKTLLLRALADLDPIDAGRVTLDGAERAAVPGHAWRRRVLYLHQTPPRLPGTVAENLARVAALGGPVAAHAVPGLPTGLDLDPALDAARLSGGQAQLLALQHAWRRDPDVYLLDESTSALDAGTSALVEGVLRTRLAAGRALLWVSHDEGLAARLGARVLVLDAGRLAGAAAGTRGGGA